MKYQLSTSLTLVRRRNATLEVFWGQRCPDRVFLGGFHAYFAGSVESEDDQLPADDPTSSATARAALRECFEECGVLFSTKGIKRVPLKSRTPETLKDWGTLATSRLHQFGTWTTPEWLTPNFTTSFYGLLLTDEEGKQLDDLSEHLDPREFCDGAWISAEEAIERWQNGDAFLTTPLTKIVIAIADSSGNTDALPSVPALGEELESPPTSETTEICGGVVLLPLKTLTIPPATHTNAVIVGKEEFVVIDPGTSDPDHIQPLLDHIESRQEKGQQLMGVVLTHHHRDHVGGLEPLRPLTDKVFAHPETLSLLPQLETLQYTTRELVNGQELELDHPGPLTAHHTPGHAPGHLAFSIPSNALVISGDLVASTGTIIVNPEDGNMGQYLASLRRLRDLSARFLLPSHGYLIAQPTEHIDHYIAHRNQREKLVLEAIRTHSPATASDLVPPVYPDVPEAIWPLAAISLRAHLDHLVEQGLVRRDGERWEEREKVKGKGNRQGAKDAKDAKDAREDS